MKAISAIGLLIGLLVLLVGCGPTSGVEGREADIRGIIADISPATPEGIQGGVVGAVLIEGAIEEDTTFDRAYVTVTDKTDIYRQDGERLRPASFADLAIGLRVQARFTGPVAESYPVQATASEIVILEPTEVPVLGNEESPLPEPGISPLPQRSADIADAAVSYLAGRLGVSPDGISLLSLEPVQWPDTSLGCPEPGMMYAQVIVPGYRVVLEVEGARYEVHTDETGQRMVSCGGGSE